MLRLLLTVFIFTLLFSCNTKPHRPSFSQAQIDSLAKACLNYRRQTEADFKTASWSPLTAEDKTHFTHLNYFPYDISWRYVLTVHLYNKPDSTTILGSRTGDVRPALRYGYILFTRKGKDQRLEIIKILPRKPQGPAHLFLGFWDETSGSQSYAGGRYIDMEENSANQYIIDFNYAYNPYCAYSHRYSCAIPPLENHLTVAVRAGEKKYKEH